MKIKDKTQNISESINLSETFNRTPNLRSFLNEAGDNESNRNLYSLLALTESMSDLDGQFVFDNGMGIPALGSRALGVGSLNEAAKRAKNANEFVSIVNEEICKAKLDFSLNEDDQDRLYTEYLKQI